MHPFYNPWKHKKTQIFSGVFSGYKMGTLARDWLKVMHFTLIMGHPHLLETSKASSYRHLRVYYCGLKTKAYEILE